MPSLRVRLATATAIAAVLFLAHGHGQEPARPIPQTARPAATAAAPSTPGVSPRQVVASFGLPGIDRGLRDTGPGGRPFAAAVAAAARGDRSTPYVAGKVIVKFKAGREPRQIDLQRENVPVRAITHPTHADFDVLRIDAAANPETVARTLAARDDVEYAQAAYRVHAMSTPNDPYYHLQWNFPAIDLDRAWDINPGADSSIIVAVIDSGIAYEDTTFRFQAAAFSYDGQNFPALGTIDVPFAQATDLGPASRFVKPYDFIWDDDNPVDMDGHGTHVAGTIGEDTNNNVGAAGVAYNVQLMPVKVVSGDWDDIFGSPNEGTDDVVAQGIRYAVDNGAKVLNMSIGRTGPPAPVIQSALQYAVSKGAFVAIAAGNDYEDGNPNEVPASYAQNIKGVVAVGAVGRDLNRAPYSSTGPYVELAAPGGDFDREGVDGMILQQTYDDTFVSTYLDGPARFEAPRFDTFAYMYYEGTSMATPHVSGLAALLIKQGITTPAAIEAAMERFATDRGPTGRDDEYGYGIISTRNTLFGLGMAR
jgi:serine protease